MPLILCNYDAFYDGLIAFLSRCESNGAVAAKELSDVMVSSSNEEVLASLVQFYGIETAGGDYSTHKLTRLSDIMTSTS